jgi:hypothetical protein
LKAWYSWSVANGKNGKSVPIDLYKTFDLTPAWFLFSHHRSFCSTLAWMHHAYFAKESLLCQSFYQFACNH